MYDCKLYEKVWQGARAGFGQRMWSVGLEVTRTESPDGRCCALNCRAPGFLGDIIVNYHSSVLACNAEVTRRIWFDPVNDLPGSDASTVWTFPVATAIHPADSGALIHHVSYSAGYIDVLSYQLFILRELMSHGMSFWYEDVNGFNSARRHFTATDTRGVGLPLQTGLFFNLQPTLDTGNLFELTLSGDRSFSVKRVRSRHEVFRMFDQDLTAVFDILMDAVRCSIQSEITDSMEALANLNKLFPMTVPIPQMLTGRTL